VRHLPPLDADLDPAEVVGALAPLLGPARASRLDAIAAGRLDGVSVVIEDLLDPHNYGAVLRSCEAMGALHVHTINSKNRFRVSARVTQGCERWLDIHPFEAAAASIAALHKGGWHVLAAVPGAALSVDDIDEQLAGARVALAFGNEHLGLSPELRALADGEFSIPMHGASQSLNVSVSVAVSLHVVTEARRKRLGRAGDLDEDALQRLRARYYAADVRGHRAVIDRWRQARTP
jgi:tRNA (guanosine-2'-O-)-methyltransferase